MSLRSSLDPRRHLAAAIGWSILVVVSLASLVAGNLAAAEAERAARASAQQLMSQFATQIDYGLGMNLRTRLSIVQATAAQIAASEDRGADALRRHLDAVQAQFPEFVWLGVANARGVVIAATDNVLQGESVAQKAWFVKAGSGPHLSDVQKADSLEKHLSRPPDGQSLRFVAAAAPIRSNDNGNGNDRGNGGNDSGSGSGSGGFTGVVGAYLSWQWIDRLQAELLGSLDSHRQLELLLADRNGVVLAGPQDWVGRSLGADDDLSEGGAYIVGRHVAKDAAEAALGWSVIVRQADGLALGAVHGLRRTVFATVLLAGVMAAVVALAITHWLTRRLAGLAAQATAVRQGRRALIAVPAGEDEVSRIGATISELVGYLQTEKAALAQLNAELDARVVERTARIERLADESRHAAVARERLRMARDLHDTLAHSLMALLTQLRLVRKLKDKLSVDEFADELARAEAVAASGLAEARAAIARMRHGTVRENGLAAALRDLLARFGERTGVAVTLQAQGRAADLAEERAETLYRIVEEALRNVERHARAQAVVVEIADLATTADTLAPRASLSVRDDGVGFDMSVSFPGHYGMLGIREQADLIGAALAVHSSPGQGTEVRLEFAA